MTGDSNRGTGRSSRTSGRSSAGGSSRSTGRSSRGSSRSGSDSRSSARSTEAGSSRGRNARSSAESRDRRRDTLSEQNKSEDTKERPKIYPFVAYLDTEFNAFDYYGQNEGIQEVIEIGLVIMRKDELVDGFRSFCALKEGHVLTRRSEQLTGICPDDLADAPHFADVIEHMNVFLDMYNPKDIYAYGPEDRMQLLKTSELYNIRNSEMYYINRIQDIMKNLSKKLGAREKSKLSLSVKDICAVCGIDAKGIHDAYNDALYLGRCSEMIKSGQVDPSRLDAVLADKNWLSGYRSSRRFKDRRETVMLRDEQLEPIRYAISRLSQEHRYPDHQLRALWDDLLVITGREPEFE